MRSIPNKQLTKNYTLWEMIEGQLPEKGREMNWKNIHEMDLDKITEAAKHAQTIRDLINKEFKLDGVEEIKFIITSGWRCKEWELIQKRSGNSQHTKAAYDAVPSGCSVLDAAAIIGWLYNRFYKNYNGGFAIKRPTTKDGKMVSAGFVHFDFRGYIARWTY